MNEQHPRPKKNDRSTPVNKSNNADPKEKEVEMPDKKERQGAESTEAEKNEEKPETPQSVKDDHGAPQPPTNPGPQGIH